MSLVRAEFIPDANIFLNSKLKACYLPLNVSLLSRDYYKQNKYCAHMDPSCSASGLWGKKYINSFMWEFCDTTPIFPFFLCQMHLRSQCSQNHKALSWTVKGNKHTDFNLISQLQLVMQMFLIRRTEEQQLLWTQAADDGCLRASTVVHAVVIAETDASVMFSVSAEEPQMATKMF